MRYLEILSHESLENCTCLVEIVVVKDIGQRWLEPEEVCTDDQSWGVANVRLESLLFLHSGPWGSAVYNAVDDWHE